MTQHRMLFVGSHHPLVTRLKKEFDVSVEANLSRAQTRLRDEWFSLAIIQLRPGEEEDEETLQFCLRIDKIVPQIILSPGVLDQRGRTVRRILARLEHSLPVLTVLMEADGDEVIFDTIKRAVRSALIEIDKPRLDGIDFYTLARTLMPASDPGKWVGELRFLLAQLFQDCVSVHFETPDYLPKTNGEMAAILAIPETENVCNQHPLVVKCGLRNHVENLETRYKNHFYPLSMIRPAGISRTAHFGAIALPAPFRRDQSLETFTSFYYKQGFDEDNIKKICETVDHLFETTFHAWYMQDRIPNAEEGKTLNQYFADTWQFGNETRFMEVIDNLLTKPYAKSINLELSQRSTTFGALRAGSVRKQSALGFRIGAQSYSFPNPLDHLFLQSSALANIRPAYVQITHADFRGANLCVDTKGQTVLEGHENMAWRPAISDVAGLESTIKYNCLGERQETRNLKFLYEMERTLLDPSRFDEELSIDNGGIEIKKAMRIIGHLRKSWGFYLASDGIQEYYACLFYFAMRELLSDNRGGKQISDIRKMHALISAAMICYRIAEWGPDFNWPGPTIPYGG